MGDELGGLGAGPLPGRKSLRPAGAEVRISGAGGRRARPDLPPHRACRRSGASRRGCASPMRSAPSRSPSTASLSGCSSAAPRVAPGTNRPVSFGGKPSVTIEPGKDVWSDAVALPFVKDAKSARRAQARGQLPRRGRDRPDDLARQGAADLLRHGARRGREGTSRRTRPRSRSRTASWFFLDARRHDGAGRHAG